MKKVLAQSISLLLSFMLAFSVFSVVPVYADSTAEPEVDTSYENITIKGANGKLSDSSVSFADKKANLIVNSSLAGTEMTVNGMDSAYLESTFRTKTNQVGLVSFLPYRGKKDAYDTPARTDLPLTAEKYGYLADRKIYDSATTTTPGFNSMAWINGTEGTSYEQWYKATHNGSVDGLLKDEQRVSAGCYDADVILTLNSLTKIDSLYLFSHPELRISPKTYAIFASDNEADLFEKGKQIVFYNYSPTNTENKYAFNNAGGDGTSRRSEGAVYTFTGTKPTARFIGIRFYDLNQDRNTDFALYDFGVYGESILHIEPQTGNGTDFYQKSRYLDANSKLTGTNLKLCGIDQDYLNTNFSSRTNSISQIEFSPYTGTYDDATGEFGARPTFTFSSTSNSANFNDMIDTSIGKDGAWGTNFYNNDYVTGKNGYSYEEYMYKKDGTLNNVLYSKDRVKAGSYDMDMTLTLSGKTSIDSFYMCSHPTLEITPATYAVFASNDKASLYEAGNQILYYDYYNIVKATNGASNINAFNNTSTARRPESYVYTFNGEKPFAKYIGIRFYDLSWMSPTRDKADSRYAIFSIGVYGDKYLNIEKETNSTVTFDNKAKYLNADSNLAGTNLKLCGIDDTYLREQYSARTNYISKLELTPFKGVFDSSSTAENDDDKFAPPTTEVFSDASFKDITDLDIFDKTNKDTSWGPNTGINGSSGCTYETYMTKLGKSGQILYGSERVEKGFYDADLTLTLSKKVSIDSLFIASHCNLNLSFATYAVFVSDNKETLYDPEHQIAYYDYSGVRNLMDNKYAFNNCNNLGLSTDSRRSETQVFTFTQERAVGKYVGFRMYDASFDNTTLPLCIFDIGVYGTPAGFENALAKTAEFEVNGSDNAPLACTKTVDITRTFVDNDGNDVVTVGDSVTATAPDLGEKYHFLGWYKDGSAEPVSTEPTYTFNFDGDKLTPKYATNCILSVDASDVGNVLKLHSDCIPTANFTYDDASSAMKLTNNTEEDTVLSALLANFKVDGVDAFSTLYEPWTTYKYTVVAKIAGPENATVQVSLSPNAIANRQAADVTYTAGEDFKATTIYFNSGAANYDANLAAATKCLSTNMFNFGLPAGCTMYVKSFEIEKVNNVSVTASNAQVSLPDNGFKWGGDHATNIAPNPELYGGNTTIKTVVPWIKGQLDSKNIVAAVADGAPLNFTVTPDEGYEVTAVKANGTVLDANPDGTYTLESAAGVAYDDAADDYVAQAQGSDIVRINVETALKPYKISFVGRNDTVVYETTVTKNSPTLSEDQINKAKECADIFFGYKFKNFDEELEGKEFKEDKIIRATYKRDLNIEYNVTCGEQNNAYSFDTMLRFRTETEEILWTVNGKNFDYGATAKVYVCTDMVVAEGDAAGFDKNTPFVTVLGTAKKGNSFITFSHVYNPTENAITDSGVSFISETMYTDISTNGNVNTDWKKFEFANTKSPAVANCGALSGKDFMGILYGIPEGKTRHAQGYVEIGGTTYLTDAVSNAQ